MLFTKGDRNKTFVFFILISYPLLNISPFKYFTGFDVITYFFFFIFFKKNVSNKINLTIYKLLLLGFATSVALGLILSEEKIYIENVYEFIRIFPVFIFSYIVIYACKQDRNFLYQIQNYLRITLIVSFAFLICQFIFGVNFSLSLTMNPNIVSTSGIRYPSFMIDPQVYSQFLGALSFICLIKPENEIKISKLNYLLVTLSVFGILLAGGRAGLIGWCIGLGLLVLFSNNKYRIAMLLSAGVIYLLILSFPDKFVIFNRGTDLNDAYAFRTSIWADAFQIFFNHPFLGIGINNYANYVSAHNPDQVWLIDNELVSFDHPESGYLKYLTEFGAIGFVLFFLFIIGPVISIFFRYLKSKDTNIILLISALICWLIGFYSTYSFGDVRIKILVGTLISMMIIYNTDDVSTEEENESIENIVTE